MSRLRRRPQYEDDIKMKMTSRMKTTSKMMTTSKMKKTSKMKTTSKMKMTSKVKTTAKVFTQLDSLFTKLKHYKSFWEVCQPLNRAGQHWTHQFPGSRLFACLTNPMSAVSQLLARACSFPVGRRSGWRLAMTSVATINDIIFAKLSPSPSEAGLSKLYNHGGTATATTTATETARASESSF